MDPGIRIFASDVPPTRLGRLIFAGETIAAEPAVPGPLRVLDHFVLSIVTHGKGVYRHSDGRTEPIGPNTVTILRPGVAHWYGTAPGGRWTELFAVFSGPVFDTFAESSVIATDGPRHVSHLPSTASLRTALAAKIQSRRAAEHQLLSIASWLVDIDEPETDDQVSATIGVAAIRLGNDLKAELDVHAIAAESGLSYDAFRRRFVAEIGLPPAAYRNAKRLQTASTLLRVTDRTLADIARLLGYVDEFHFSRRFRAHFGASPGGYRRNPTRLT